MVSSWIMYSYFSLAGAIRERGGTLASEPADMPWGARAFDLVDPDGFRLTITS